MFSKITRHIKIFNRALEIWTIEKENLMCNSRKF